MRKANALPDKKLRNPMRILKQIQELPAQFETGFPEAPGPNKNWYWKLPVPDKLLAGPKTTTDLQRVCIQVLVDICAKLVRNKPEAYRDTRVVAWISLPDLAMSSIIVFHKPSALQSRIEDVPRVASGRSLIREMKLQTNFPELGCSDSYEAGGRTHRFESWIIGEIG